MERMQWIHQYDVEEVVYLRAASLERKHENFVKEGFSFSFVELGLEKQTIVLRGMPRYLTHSLRVPKVTAIASQNEHRVSSNRFQYLL